jgi:glycine/D-amino acid oxidase-like deaminating enzyme
VSDGADVVVDVAILGGGIAGLWLLDALEAAGYTAALFEAGELAAGQTVASQGIIHGGAKYTLGLALDRAVRELREMPAAWRASLEGAGGPDLRGARVLSPHTYMWIPRQPGGRVIGLFSRLLMRSRVQALPRDDWPEPLRSSGAPGTVLALDEMVLDVPSVVAALRSRHRGRIRKIPGAGAVDFADGGRLLRAGGLAVAAARFVFAAGAGNEGLMARAGVADVPAHRRPLHQVMARGVEHPLYAHCIGRSTKPLATVTSHLTWDGDRVWYVGGLIAEDGVAESEERLIERARRELPRLFPGADLSGAGWATFRVDRAEGGSASGRRPAGPVVRRSDRFLVVWPTKLALAPHLAARVVAALREEGVRPAPARLDALAELPEPAVALPPWERVERWR